MLCIGTMTITFGCGKKDKQETSVGTEQTADQTNDKNSEIEYNVDDYVKLGDYLGIEVEKEEEVITEEDMEIAINNICRSFPEVVKTDKEVVEDGDVVNINYEGLLDGEAFEGGTAEDTNLTIGSDTFIDGFEDGLIGAKAGETVSLNLTFPKDYQNDQLKGQEVVFNVKINYIGEEKTPELTEEFIATYTGKEMTIDEFREQLKSELLEEKKTTIESNKLNAVITAVIENSTVSGFPEGMQEQEINNTVEQIKLEAEGAEMEFADYLSQYYNLLEEEFNEQIEAYTEEYLTKRLITEAIIKKEGLELTDKEYKTAVKEYAETMQSSVEDLENRTGKDSLEEYFQWQKTWNYVLDASVEK